MPSNEVQTVRVFLIELNGQLIISTVDLIVPGLKKMLLFANEIVVG